MKHADVLTFPRLAEKSRSAGARTPEAQQLLLMASLLTRKRPERIPRVIDFLWPYVEDVMVPPPPRSGVGRRQRSMLRATLPTPVPTAVPRPQAKYWILDGDGHPQALQSVVAWDEWLLVHLDDTRVAVHSGTDWLMETRFHGIAQALDPLPMLWITRIYGGSWDRFAEVYPSREQAYLGHMRLLTLLRTYAEPDTRIAQ